MINVLAALASIAVVASLGGALYLWFTVRATDWRIKIRRLSSSASRGVCGRRSRFWKPFWRCPPPGPAGSS